MQARHLYASVSTGEADPNDLDASAEDAREELSGVHVQKLAAGSTIAGKYLVHGKLGQGGFAVVYDAEHVGLGRRLAIKVVHVHEDMPRSLLARSRREARISALVRHPNVLEVFDTGSLDDGSPYLVMERIDGETLTERLTRDRLGVSEAVEIGIQLANALDALAEQKIIHRDIKPDNVMVTTGPDGKVLIKVVDFGISTRVEPSLEARLTTAGMLIGTPYYMSPEQLKGDPLDERSDVYSAGVVLYEALTGRVPHERTGLSELMLAVWHDTIRPLREHRPGCPRELERIVMKALAKDREERYPSARALADDLAAFAATPEPSERCTPDAAVVPVELLGSTPSVRAFGRLRELTARGGVRQRAMAALGGMVACAGALALALPADDAVARQDVREVASASLVQPAARKESAPEVYALASLEASEASTEAEEAPPAPTEEPAPQKHARKRLRPRAPEAAHAPLEFARPVVASAPATGRPSQLLSEALAAYAQGRYAQAHQLYRRVVEVAPDDPQAWRGLSLVAARTGDREGARAALARYLALRPHAPDADALRRRVQP